jgi:hypothetical protein
MCDTVDSQSRDDDIAHWVLLIDYVLAAIGRAHESITARRDRDQQHVPLRTLKKNSYDPFSKAVATYANAALGMDRDGKGPDKKAVETAADNLIKAFDDLKRDRNYQHYETMQAGLRQKMWDQGPTENWPPYTEYVCDMPRNWVLFRSNIVAPKYRQNQVLHQMHDEAMDLDRMNLDS